MNLAIPNINIREKPSYPNNGPIEVKVNRPLAKPKISKPNNNSQWNRSLSFFGYNFASALHLLSAFLNTTKMFSESLREKIDDAALNLSKAIHTIIYFFLSHNAWKDGNTLDSLSKFLDPTISAFSSIDNMNLSKGIASGLTLLDYSHTSDVDNQNGKWKNIKDNLDLTVKMASDIYGTNQLSKERNIFLSKSNEKGHTLALVGHITFISAALGLIFKPLNKICSTIRNIVGIAGNTVIMLHPDNDKKLSGVLFNTFATLDTVQKFIPKDLALTLNNINMAIYNTAIYYYGKLSAKRSDGSFDDYEPVFRAQAAT